MTWSLLLAALIAVESGGNPAAVGDNGRAVGCLQIWPCVVQDVNRIAGTSYTLEDRKSPAKSRQMCLIYLQHWAKKYENKTGLRATEEILCALWNGGPNGYKLLQTNKGVQNYVRKVMRVKRDMDGTISKTGDKQT